MSAWRASLSAYDLAQLYKLETKMVAATAVRSRYSRLSRSVDFTGQPRGRCGLRTVQCRSAPDRLITSAMRLNPKPALAPLALSGDYRLPTWVRYRHRRDVPRYASGATAYSGAMRASSSSGNRIGSPLHSGVLSLSEALIKSGIEVETS